MDGLRDILALIGMGTLLYFFHQYWEKRKEEKKIAEQQLHFKIRLLSWHHPVFSRLFNEFDGYNESGWPIVKRGQTCIVLGRGIHVFYPYQIKDFEARVLSKLKMIESTDEGRHEVAQILTKYQNMKSNN